MVRAARNRLRYSTWGSVLEEKPEELTACSPGGVLEVANIAVCDWGGEMPHDDEHAVGKVA